MSGEYFNLTGGNPSMLGNGLFNAETLRVEETGLSQGHKYSRSNSRRLNSLDAAIECAVTKTIFTGRFKWRGTAVESIYDGYIESVIYENGFCLATNFMGFPLFLPASVTGWDYMYQPNSFTLYANSSELSGKVISIDDCVIIKESNACQIVNQQGWPRPSLLGVRGSEKVADAGRGVEIYLAGLKNPVIIAGSDKNALSRQTIAQALLQNDPYVVLTPKKNKMTGEEMPLFVEKDTHNAQDLMGLMQGKHHLRGELYSLLGIGGVSKTKNAYVSGDELDKQESHTDIILRAAKENREKAAEEMREKFGWDIEVTSAIEEMEEENQPDPEEMGDNVIPFKRSGGGK